MAKQVISKARFKNGISDFLKEGSVDSYSFGRSINDSNPREITLGWKPVKESGTVVVDLPKWGEQTINGLTYVLGDAGTFYQRTLIGSWTALRTIPNCHGNGLCYFAEDNSVYYTGDKVIGRYGRINDPNAKFNDDFLGSQGGVRLNTYSLVLDGATQYGSKTDAASLSITGDLSIEASIKPAVLPTVGNSQTILAKWDESGATRSYKFDIAGVSASFGSGSDGALTIAADTTEAPIDSACTGILGAYTLSATNASFAAGQILLIHQTQGSDAGLYERNEIVSYTAGTITLLNPLLKTYTTGSQVRVLKQYSAVTINSGKTYSAKAWNGTTGGILAFLCNGTLTISGSISANGGTTSTITGATGGGFRGGNGIRALGANSKAYCGESNLAVSSQIRTANGNGGGGGQVGSSGDSSGGGGANGSIGIDGKGIGSSVNLFGLGGSIYGNASLTTLPFGGGGGGGAQDGSATGDQAFGGGAGGGIILIYTNDLATITGSITANGGNGGTGVSPDSSGGGGAGGSILLKFVTGSLGVGLITANGGTGYGLAGNGGVGRIHADYYTSISGSTTPTLDSTQDNNLSNNTTYQLRFSVSTDGTAYETLTRQCDLTAGVWKHIAVTYDASASLARFYLNANLLGTSTGALTSISDNASALYLGAHKGASAVGNFLNGKIDEVRLWNDIRTADEINFYKENQIPVNMLGLVAYYTLNNASTDGTANANHLTLTGSPAYSDDVPFLSPTTRNDIDQSQSLSGNTYTIPTSISEVAADMCKFTPTKDPQKSISILIASIGTGNLTVTVHDSNNVVIASKTVDQVNILAGQFEVTFDTPWRPLFNEEYHFHLTSTVAATTVTTGTASSLATVDFKTYFQFLVDDTEFHPIAKMLQFLVFGNERYVAKYEATLYDPNYITLPAGWRIRCFGYYNEYLVIGCMKGDNIYDFDNGRLYFWDGVSTTYNFYLDVPEGGINAILGSKGKLFVWAGYQGDMLIYQGSASASKIKRLPKSTDNNYIEVYPQAVTMWKSYLHFGVGRSDSTIFQRGVFSYGSPNIRYDDSLSFQYIQSGGNYLNTTETGLVMVVGKKLLVGWRDGISYGIDMIDPSNGYAPSGTVEFMVEDSSVTWKEKEAISLIANFKPLQTGESVQIKYKLDRNDNWTLFPVEDTVGTNFVRGSISGTGKTRYNEIEYACDIFSSTGTTTPTLLNVSLEIDDMSKETRLGG